MIGSILEGSLYKEKSKEEENKAANDNAAGLGQEDDKKSDAELDMMEKLNRQISMLGHDIENEIEEKRTSTVITTRDAQRMMQELSASQEAAE